MSKQTFHYLCAQLCPEKIHNLQCVYIILLTSEVVILPSSKRRKSEEDSGVLC